jgi:hypothetical protein
MRSRRPWQGPARGRRLLAAAAVLLGLFVMHGLGIGHGHEIVPPRAEHSPQSSRHSAPPEHAGPAEHAALAEHALAGHHGHPGDEPSSPTVGHTAVLAAASSASPSAPDSRDGLGTHALLTCLAVLPVLLLALGGTLRRRWARHLPILRDVARWALRAPAGPPGRPDLLRPALHELCVLRT